MYWSNWKQFPEPSDLRSINTPIGCGLYELRNKSSNEFVLVGMSINIKKRMKSLMPKPFGVGTRNNMSKRYYVLNNYRNIEYRTMLTDSITEAKSIEKSLLRTGMYLFNT